MSFDKPAVFYRYFHDHYIIFIVTTTNNCEV